MRNTDEIPNGSPRSREEAVLLYYLNERQIRVLNLLAENKTDKEIADELGLTEHTEHKIVRKLFDKLGIHKRDKLGRIWRELPSEKPVPPGPAKSGEEITAEFQHKRIPPGGGV
jgi:DNA-binding NarL/FixJ family response regulator